MPNVKELFRSRGRRVRRRLRKANRGRMRLSVFRSSQHIYAQLIDDEKGHTVAAASSIDKELRESIKTGADKEAAGKVGELLAKRAQAAGVKEVVFDRGSFRFHGRVKALADAAREAGLVF